MRESAIERPVCQFARDHGIVVIKIATIGGAQRGVPDRLFLKGGKLCFVEFKATGKKPRALQMKWLEDLSAAGFHATWVDDAERGKEYLRGVFGI